MSTTATIHIQTSTKCSYRFVTEEFKPTRNWSDTLSITTDTNSYAAACSTIAQNLYTTVQGELAAGNTVGATHIKVTVENATAAFAGKGLQPMAKQSIDLTLSGDEVTSVQVVNDYLVSHTKSLIALAKY